MAVNVVVALNDAEQAVVEGVALKVAPNATPAQILAWAEKQAKAGLRQAVLTARANFEAAEFAAAKVTNDEAARASFPDPNGA